MIPPPSLKQIDTSQLEEAEPWFLEQFLSQLNPFIRQVTQFLEDLSSRSKEEREVTFTTGASVSLDASPFPLVLMPQKVARPRSVVVACVSLASGSPIAAVWPFWDLTAKGEVRIRWFSGLDTGTQYTVRLRFE